MSLATARFIDPPWNAPLNASHVIAAIPPGSTLAGMFFTALLDAAKNRPLKLSQPPRDRYLAFGFYPIAEFAPLLKGRVQIATRGYDSADLLLEWTA